jgi:hypothetical protein
MYRSSTTDTGKQFIATSKCQKVSAAHTVTFLKVLTFLRNVRPVGETDNSLSFCTEVKNDWSYNSTPLPHHKNFTPLKLQMTPKSPGQFFYSVQHYLPPSLF